MPRVSNEPSHPQHDATRPLKQKATSATTRDDTWQPKDLHPPTLPPVRIGGVAPPPPSDTFPLPPSVIRPGLFLGSFHQASNVAMLKRLEITHVLNVTHECENVDPDSFKYANVCVRDETYEALGPHFSRASEFIVDALRNNEKVLVHCRAGISRSASIVIAYLMQHERLWLSQAFEAVKNARPQIEPNCGFLRELRELEVQLFGESKTKERLTLLDDCSAQHDASAQALAKWISAAGAGENDNNLLRQAAVQALHQAEAPTLAQWIEKTLENYGNTGGRDCLARSALAQCLREMATLDSNDAAKAHEAFALLTEPQRLGELCVDVPYAAKFLQELASSLPL